MKLNESWLKEWLNLNLNTEQLLEQITMIGFDVNIIKSINFSKNKIIVGEIVQFFDHPSCSKYKIIKINIGKKKLLNFICDFCNYKIGMKVCVALPGVVLANEFKVEKKNIYSEISECFICSYNELFLLNSNKVIELPNDYLIGDDINKYFNFNENIFEIHSTQNRSDCLSVLGIVRELAAVNNIKLNIFDTNFLEKKNKINFPIYIEAVKACPRFLGRIIKNININTSIPIWMRKRLFFYGILPVNTIIDIINYVSIELGQPIYAYDFDKLEKFFAIRMAKEGENIILFNDKKIILKSDTLVTSDEKGVLSIAGIIGGKRSFINKKTTNIFLESAYFNSSLICKESNFYSIFTDSSNRFISGVDFNIQYKSINRAVDLIINICGGTVENIIDVTNLNNLPKFKKIKLSKKKINRLIGFYISNIEILKILKNLGFKVDLKDNFWYVTVPSWRFDIKIEEDLIEEIVRIYGYHKIPIIQPNFNLVNNFFFDKNFFLNDVKNLLVNRGYNEIITYSFVDPKFQSLLFPKAKLINLSNPISLEMSSMRVSLIVGLLSTVIYNKNRQQSSFRFFEFGLCFLFNKNSNSIFQEPMLSGIISGNRYKENWINEKRKVDFYDIKGDVECILRLTGCLDNVSFKFYNFSTFHPFQSAKIYLNGIYIGFIGLIHPEIECKLELGGEVFVFELKWNLISKFTNFKINEISKFPVSKKDISIVVPYNVLAEDLLLELKMMRLNKVISIDLLDVYYGKNIKKGYKSITIRLYLQDFFGSLEEEEIINIINKCVFQLEIRFNSFLRK